MPLNVEVGQLDRGFELDLRCVATPRVRDDLRRLLHPGLLVQQHLRLAALSLNVDDVAWLQRHCIETLS